jgi:UPF0755 protein
VVRALSLLFSLVIIVAVASAVYVATGNATSAVRSFAENWGAPVSERERLEVFTVRDGMTAREIGQELEDRGLIRSAFAFRVLAEQQEVGGQLAAGDYEISPSMSTEEVLAVLASGEVRRGERIAVIEGWRAEEIAAKVEEMNLAASGDFMALVRDTSEVPVPRDLPLPGGRAEGYLFPATYEWDEETGLIGLVTQMLEQFDAQVSPELRERFEQRGLTLNEAVILASIVEREAAREEERALVASVYENRLKAGMLLQADPTTQYALADAEPEITSIEGYWRELSSADLQIDSPFNTYVTDGLPPGAICNPGLASLQAVAEPAETDYLYFVARGDGSHAFARTQEEHFENIQKYQS